MRVRDLQQILGKFTDGEKGTNISDCPIYIETKDGYMEEAMGEIASTHLALIQGGDMRFIVSVLSLLNYDLIVQQKKEPAKTKIAHVRYGRKVPTNEYSLINIDLPKPKGKTVYEKIFTGRGIYMFKRVDKNWKMFSMSSVDLNKN